MRRLGSFLPDALGPDFGKGRPWIFNRFGETPLQAPRLQRYPARQCHEGFGGGLGDCFVGGVEVFRQDVRQLSLPPQGDELERRQPDRGLVAAARLAQGMMEKLDVVQDGQAQIVRQAVV